MSTTTTTHNDILADFALQIFERARELQKERTGLLSNKEAMKRASLEVFAKALTDIQNVIAYTRLFGGEEKEAQIKSMLDYGLGAFSGISKNVQNFEIEQIHNIQDDSKKPIQTKKVRETECIAP